MNLIKILSLLVVLFTSMSIFAQDSVIVAIGEAELEKDKLYFGRPLQYGSLNSQDRKTIDKALQIVKDDFNFYKKYFRIITYKDEFINTEGNLQTTSILNNTGIRYVFQFSISAGNIGLKLFDNVSKSYKFDTMNPYKSNLRGAAHNLAAQAYEAITGKKSIFNSKIYFVTDRHSRGKEIIKELYVMDFDGENKRRITNHNSIVVGPDISFNNNEVMYTLFTMDYKRQRRTWLYHKNLRTNRHKIISKRKGLNAGAIFTPSGKEVILTLTHTGNAEIYAMNTATNRLRKITSHFGIDVDPSMAKGGQLMAFLSSRPGKAMIYTLDPRGTEKSVKRIGFKGRFNGTPRFSRDGLEIVYSSWLDNKFDLFRIDRNGNNSVRLTKNFGSNEDPTFSPDNEFIAFSSQRVLSEKRALTDIWIIDREGEVIKKVTHNFGHCVTPRWSK